MLRTALIVGALSAAVLGDDESSCQMPHVAPQLARGADPGPLGGAEGFLLSAKQRAALVSRPLPPILFAKTHKTASSTVACVLLRAGDWRNLTFMVAQNGSGFNFPGPFPGEPWNAWAAAADRSPRGRARFDLIVNHAVLDLPAMLGFLRKGPERPLVVTVLREPWRQAQSAYNWYPRLRARSPDEHLDWAEGLAEVASAEAAAARNPQAHDLGWYRHTGGSTAHDAADEGWVGPWVSATLSAVDVALPAEHLEEGLLVLRDRLGGRLAVEELASLRMKEAGPGATVRFSEAQRARAGRVSRVDAAIYAAASARFNQEVGALARAESAAGGFAEDLERLRALNRRLAEACEGMPQWGYAHLHPPTSQGEAKERACPVAARTDARGYTFRTTARLCAARTTDVPAALCEDPHVAGSLLEHGAPADGEAASSSYRGLGW